MLSDRTLRSILEDPLLADAAPDAILNMDIAGQEYYDWTLSEIGDRMGWRFLERGFARLYEAAARGNYRFRLYSADECEGAPEKERASIVYFPSDDPEADNRPFILIVPGGGCETVWNMNEGWPVGQRFNALGHHVFILTYQVGIDGTAVRAMDDISRAMEIIAARKEAFRVDPGRYITCGFSSGGYIVCLWNTEKGFRAFGLPEPEACFAVYPFVSYRIVDALDWDEEDGGDGEDGEDWDKDDLARLGVGCTMEEACNSCFEIPLHVEGFPPTAVFAAEGDEMVVQAKRLAEALEQAGVPCMTEIGPDGWHGFADGTGMCMEGWTERAVKWAEKINNG